MFPATGKSTADWTNRPESGIFSAERKYTQSLREPICGNGRTRTIIDDGGFPFKMKMVGLTLGRKPIDDYAPDFWLISTPVGLAAVDTTLEVELPDEYAEESGGAADATITELPFHPSVNPSAREVARKKGLDFAE